MTKYEYNKSMYELAVRMAVAKRTLEGNAVSDFFIKAAQGFSARMDEMSNKEACLPATEEEKTFYKNYLYKLQAIEKEASNAGY